MLKRLLFAFGLLLAGLAASAVEAPPLATDPALEARVMAVAEELRCLVCQNEALAAGETPPQIVDFMVSRYGEFVRYRPAFNPTNALLWLGPFGLLGLGLLVLARNVRQRREAPRELDAAERRRVAELLGGRGTEIQSSARP